ncbi:hypothetical protein PENTCL1PPCAC_2414, partial [Pristionchus entomophagus]
RGEIPIDTRIAIVKDFIVNRLTQSACASKYNVKLSYVQYVIKRFRSTGTLYAGDTQVNQNELPRDPSGTIRESALLRRLNSIPNPLIMTEKEKEMGQNYLWKKTKRRGRKRKSASSEEREERIKSIVWSDIDEEEEER